MHNPVEIRKIQLDHAWKYFERHATQRIALFNFFLVISGILLTVLAAEINNETNPAVGISLSGLMILFSFIFHKLDLRTKFLIKRAEKEITRIETESGFSGLFSLEAARTKGHIGSQKWGLRQWSYSKSFSFVQLIRASSDSI